ncbi:MAG TPA: phage tail sheath C-terminal domain-containing protein [Polyangia bacterium]|nr:phage tail sheath C-terminal domain-containing protein [Polyangia bacterium]
MTEFVTWFGDYTDFAPPYSPLDPTSDTNHAYLQEAVFGFFNNQGTRCYVTRVTRATDITASSGSVLEKLEAIDDISTVAAPGLTSPGTLVDGGVSAALIGHCAKMKDRVVILDTWVDTTLSQLSGVIPFPPGRSQYAALYFPWIAVMDPRNPSQTMYVPPSGHIAGIYARVDATRGVHKAPANEPIVGALGLKLLISEAQQEGLNPQGINCLRKLNGSILVWGARTLGGDANNAEAAGDVKYISTRRLLNFLRDSIERGTQWTVFEPNTPELWAKVTRDVSAFLRQVWESGGLFGNTSTEAFFVKCDAETNPPANRDVGKMVAKVGVAVIRPAEFVIFQIGQTTAPPPAQ